MSQSEADEPEKNDENAAGAAKPGQRKLILVSVAAVVVLAVVGLVVYLLVDDSSDEASGTDVPTISGSPAPTTPKPTPKESAAVPPSSATGGITATAPADDPAAAKDVAEQAATAISGGDLTTLAQLYCDPSSVSQDDAYPPDAKVEVAGEPEITGDTATVELKLTIGDIQPTTVPLPLAKQNGRWCVP